MSVRRTLKFRKRTGLEFYLKYDTMHTEVHLLGYCGFISDITQVDTPCSEYHRNIIYSSHEFGKLHYQ